VHSLSHIDDPPYLNKTSCFAANPAESESPFKAVHILHKNMKEV